MFISSGHESEADSYVDTLSDGLKREGMKVFVAQECIQPGETWPAEIIQAINVCKVFVLASHSTSIPPGILISASYSELRLHHADISILTATLLLCLMWW